MSRPQATIPEGHSAFSLTVPGAAKNQGFRRRVSFYWVIATPMAGVLLAGW